MVRGEGAIGSSAAPNGLVQRGDVRFWIDEAVIADWIAPWRKGPGGQRRYSNTAIVATLTLGSVYRLPLRQAEGFVRRLFALMDVAIPVPDHTTLARRRRTLAVDMHTSAHPRLVDIVLDSTGLKFYGPGEWDRTKHGERRRAWRKLHVSINPATSEIVAHELTDSDTSDGAMAGPLVAGSGGQIRRVIADGAYDGQPVADAIRAARPTKSPPKIVIPPSAKSIPPPGQEHGGSERERHSAEIAASGRMNWQEENNYGLRSLAETGIGRLKGHTGGILRARTFGAQQKEVAIDITVMNRQIRAAKPVTVRVT
ncbi:MAG: IS5 family transposase [Pseudomonadota bacterium]